jgi:hypothetical protein
MLQSQSLAGIQLLWRNAVAVAYRLEIQASVQNGHKPYSMNRED